MSAQFASESNTETFSDHQLTEVNPIAVGVLSLEQLMQLAETVQRNGQPLLAVNLYQRWVEQTHDPRKHIGWFNLGTLHQAMGHEDEAFHAYQACLDIEPDFAYAQINLGLGYEKKGQDALALRAWSEVVANQFVKGNQDVSLLVTAYNHIGRLHEQKKNYKLAEKALEESLRLDSAQPHVIQHWVHIRQKSCEWPAIKPIARASLCQVQQALSPLAALALFDDPAKQFLVAHSFVSRMYPAAQLPKEKNIKHKHTKIRLGYVSGDLCVHAVGLLMADFFEAHDPSQFELYAYDYSPEDGSQHRERIKKSVAHWRDIRNLTDEQASDFIKRDEIDILIDLHGLSSGARPGIFGHRPARLQGTYLGYIGTTCIPDFDFVVTDRYAFCEEGQSFFMEPPLYVDGCFLPITPGKDEKPDQTIRAQVREKHGFDEDVFVMAAFGNVYKINETMFQVWMDLLTEIPNSVLWLIDDNPDTKHMLLEHARRHGIAADRLVLTPRVAPEEFKRNLMAADVFLDTYPYNCGSTTRDVVMMETPLVTLTGKTMVSRMGGSILNSLGLDEWIATDVKGYKEKVMDVYHCGQEISRKKYPDRMTMERTFRKTVLSFERGLKKMLQEKDWD